MLSFVAELLSSNLSGLHCMEFTVLQLAVATHILDVQHCLGQNSILSSNTLSLFEFLIDNFVLDFSDSAPIGRWIAETLRSFIFCEVVVLAR